MHYTERELVAQHTLKYNTPELFNQRRHITNYDMLAFNVTSNVFLCKHKTQLIDFGKCSHTCICVAAVHKVAYVGNFKFEIMI